MKHCAVVLTVTLAAAMAPHAESGPPPTPSVVPTTWELDFEYQTPRMITIELPGKDKPQAYWYMLYKVTNGSERDRIFVPDIVLYTDTGQILWAGKGVSGAVFEAIQKLHNNPLLVDVAAVTGRLLQGSDNAKESAAIWPDFDPEARGFDIFVVGLSGERAQLALPAPVKVTVREENGQKVEVVKTELELAKTLQLTYKLAGEAAARAGAKPELLGKKWVMR